MPHVLNYVVENAQLVTQQVLTQFEGREATVSFERAVIEALPSAPDGKTLTLVLDPEALAEFPEGTKIQVTVEGL